MGEQRIYPDHQKEERLDLVEIGDFLSFGKMQIRFHMTLQKKKFLAQICIFVPFRGGVFFGGVGVIFLTCDFFPGS